MNNRTDIDTLRAMYRTTKAGADLDVAAYVAALLGACADGTDVNAVTDAFAKLGYVTRLDFLRQMPGAGSLIAAAREARGWQGAIRVASKLCMTDVWAAAMTAHYGPTGTHESRLDTDGCPTVEALAEFPRIGERMAAAAANFDAMCGWYDRVNAGKSYSSQVVERREVRAA